jgi:hypothetical protein
MASTTHGRTSSVQELARQVLNNANIWFTTSDAQASVQACANGNESNVPATGGTTMLSAQLLEVMLIFASKHKIGIGYITNGGHSSDSAHYDGRAMDLNAIDGRTGLQGRDSECVALINDACGDLPSGVSIGQSLCAGGTINCSQIEQFDDTCNHLHVQVSGKTSSGSGPAGPSGPAGTTAGSSTGSFTENDLFAIGRASAVSTQLQLPGILNSFESIWMRGAKSIYNDEPLMGFIEQLAKASLRHFQSLPDGSFFAFFPDYFGAYGHRTPYWNIRNIEIVDGGIDLTDESLATHVFVVGDTSGMPDEQISLPEKVASKGVVTIFDAFASKFMLHKVGDDQDEEAGQRDETKTASYQRALNFLRKYGIRPHYEEATFIRNSFFEMFYAFTQFQLLWSNQFRTQFSFTFMPELYPGGIVAFDEHGFQCYVDSVTHTFDYVNGFTTQANLTAPSALDKPGKGALSAGMVQPFAKGFESSIVGGRNAGK